MVDAKFSTILRTAIVPQVIDMMVKELKWMNWTRRRFSLFGKRRRQRERLCFPRRGCYE